MEVQKNKQKAILTYNSSETCEVPAEYSRQKAMVYSKNNSGFNNAVPGEPARRKLAMMYVKMGAKAEVPGSTNEKIAFLNDFWRTIYFTNNLCPVDIPFSILMDEFVLALAHGVIDRKGNNQVAICNAFNEWVIRPDVRNRLYQKRDEIYPEKKPKQIAESATPETTEDYTDEEIIQKYNAIKPMAGIGMVDHMLRELKKHIDSRGFEL